MLRFLTFLIHENPFFFWLWLEALHGPSIPAYCSAACTSSLSCCIVFDLASVINPSSNSRSFFCQLIGLLIAFGDEFLKLRHHVSCLSLCGAPHEVLHFHQNFFLKLEGATLLQMFVIHKVSIASFWINAFSFLAGQVTFLRRQRTAVSSVLLMVRWTSNSASIDPCIPCKGPILHENPVAPLTSHMLPILQLYPEENRQWQGGL